MNKLRFLLLDANAVIMLFELGLWRQTIEKCDILIAETVVEQEAQFFFDDQGEQHGIDLSDDIGSKRISIVRVDAHALRNFLDRFDPVYIEGLDPGELESLAYLFDSDDPCLVCSSDAIVFRVLARLSRTEQGLSLEEVLGAIGLGRGLPHQFSKGFRKRWTKQGQQEMIRGIGLRSPATSDGIKDAEWDESSLW